jgi:SAM-dependent MidA family methyltransferase
VTWAPDLKSIGERPVTGIIFSNEFLDALPVHRLAWNATRQQWLEGYVAVESGAFSWLWLPPAAEWTEHLPEVSPNLAKVLPDRFTIEICPAAINWWRAAASILGRGKLLTMDYGFKAEEWLQPERAQGTLRAFRRHHLGADLFMQPGEQDLTAHVNFSALMEAGLAAGLRTESLARQSKFLTEILVSARAAPASFEPWDEKRTRQFHTLTHPEHLGHKFQVLVQSRY